VKKIQIQSKVPISVVMLTLNEEFHLPGAIENVIDWAEEIFIVDSLSTDRTVEICLEYGINIVQRPFTNFGDQWNFALQQLPIKTQWTFKLDPDERLTDDLKSEIAHLLRKNPKDNGFELKRRLWFMGKPLHVFSPVLRLWKTGTCRFSDVLVNEHPLIDGSIGKLNGIIEHLDSRDLHHWCEKQNHYTSAEAIMAFNLAELADTPMISGTSLQRRMWLKKHFKCIPFRYFLLFLYHLIWQGAWRSGYIGFTWSLLRSGVKRMVEYKYKEMLLTQRPLLTKKHNNHGRRDIRVQQF
jgi:glycosyltransferase involved in cell wall biosynthesis